MRINKTLVLIISIGALSGCAGMQDQYGGFSIRSVATGIANAANHDPESSQASTAAPAPEQWHSGVPVFHRIESPQPESTQSVSTQSVSTQSVSTQSVSTQSVSTQSVSTQSVQARPGRKRTLADLARENGMPPPPGGFSEKRATHKRMITKRSKEYTAHHRESHAISKIGAPDMSVVHHAANPGRYEASDKPIPVDLN